LNQSLWRSNYDANQQFQPMHSVDCGP
jgi:hypothetical protein